MSGAKRVPAREQDLRARLVAAASRAAVELDINLTTQAVHKRPGGRLPPSLELVRLSSAARPLTYSQRRREPENIEAYTETLRRGRPTTYRHETNDILDESRHFSLVSEAGVRTSDWTNENANDCAFVLE